MEEFETILSKKRESGKRAVVLLSGGMDSATACALACAESYHVYALTVDYHQRHAVELAAAKRVAEFLSGWEDLKAKAKNLPGKVRFHKIFRLELDFFGHSALTDKAMEVPKNRPLFSPPRSPIEPGDSENPLNKEREPSKESTPSSGSTGEGIPNTYVPGRNLIFLSLAAAWAETLQAEAIFMGANAVDYSGYPDCRPDFLKAFEETANRALKKSTESAWRIHLSTPLLSLTKAQIIQKGLELGLDYGLTWSCYDPVLNAMACGKCDSCQFRLRAFREAGVEDPLPYFSA